MKHIFKKQYPRVVIIISIVAGLYLYSCNQKVKDAFPDGTEIPAWFADTTKVDVSSLGEKYSIADYGAVADDSTLNTEVIQHLIDNLSIIGCSK